MSSKLPQDLISREQLLIIRFLQKIKKKLLCVQALRRRQDTAKRRKAWSFALRTGCARPSGALACRSRPRRGGGLHRTSGEPPRRETGPAAAAKLASSRCLRMRMHKCGSIAVGMHTTWASIIIRWRDATQSICKEIKSEDSLIKWKML